MALAGNFAVTGVLQPGSSFLSRGRRSSERKPSFSLLFPRISLSRDALKFSPARTFDIKCSFLTHERSRDKKVGFCTGRRSLRRSRCNALKQKQGPEQGSEEPQDGTKPPSEAQPPPEKTKKSLEAQLKNGTGSPSDAAFRQLLQEKNRVDKLAAKTEQLIQQLKEANDQKQSYEKLTWRQKQVISGNKSLVTGGPFTGLIEEGLQVASTVLLGRKAKGPLIEPLNIAKIRKCFSYTTYFPTNSQRYGRGAIFEGNLRGPIEEIAPKLKAEISKALGVEVVLFFLLDEYTGKQACVVQPRAEIDERLEQRRLGGVARWPLSLALLAATGFTTVFLSRFSLGPTEVDTGFEHAIPLLGGLTAVLGASEICQRLAARKYRIDLSPPYLIPSGWLGCLGVATEIESILPSRQALFDVAASRAAAGWGSSLLLAIAAFLQDGGVNGGPHPLYVQPNFFQPNFLLSFIQYVIGPYADELGNVLPHAVPELGVPVNPVAFAGLLGMVVTSLNLLPTGRLEGGRIAQALFGRRRANTISICTAILLGVGGFSGSILCLAWGFFILLFRGGEELPAEDEITPLGQGRTFFGWVLLSICILTLLPNSAGTFPSTFFVPAAFQGEL